MSETTIKIDGTEYELSDLSKNAQAQINNINFVDKKLQQLESELAVADTARMAYSQALNHEIKTQREDEHTNGK